MGLPIQYSLHLDRKLTERVPEIAASIARIARELEFQQVDDPRHLVGAACSVDNQPDPGLGWMLVQAQRHLAANETLVPEEIHVVRTVPGAGCEPANIGLSRFIDTPDWSWTGTCKTQHAAEPDAGGIDNYVRCHVALCTLLDKIKDLGVTVEVTDTNGYWTERDAKALAARVTELRTASQLTAAAK